MVKSPAGLEYNLQIENYGSQEMDKALQFMLRLVFYPHIRSAFYPHVRSAFYPHIRSAGPFRIRFRILAQPVQVKCFLLCVG